MISILILRKIDKKFLEESDMAGPFLIILIFAFSLVLQYKTCFGYLYGISVFGSFFIFLLLNLMSKERGILLYNTISVLGYCMIPIVILSFISVFLDMKGIVGGFYYHYIVAKGNEKIHIVLYGFAVNLQPQLLHSGNNFIRGKRVILISFLIEHFQKLQHTGLFIALYPLLQGIGINISVIYIMG